MKSKKRQDVTPILKKSAHSFFKNTEDIVTLQLQTLKCLNEKTHQEFQSTEQMVEKLKIDNAQNYGVAEEVFKYCLQIEDISKDIDQLEDKHTKISEYLDQLETKFKDIKKIRDLAERLKKQNQS